MRFAPVFLPDERKLNGRASQTLLRHYDRCPRSAYLYQISKGSASSPEMQRGSALHAVIEQSIQAAIEADERTIPPEIVKAIVNEVLADPQYAVPIREHDYVREAAFRFGSTFAFDPAAVVALETLFVMDLGGFEVRAKIDYAELREAGAVVGVSDWKSSRAMPGFEEVARKRPDGSHAAKNFQLIVYALVLAFGVPVRMEPCEDCITNSRAKFHGGPFFDECPMCGKPPAASGNVVEPSYVEVREPFGVAGRAQRFDLQFVYPGIEDKQGGMASRAMSLSRLELEEYRASLDGMLRRLAHSEESGDWPAVASDDACSECPARSLCPIPTELRSFKGRVNTMEEAAEAAERLDRDKAEHAARQKELREFAKLHGPVYYGGGMVMDFSYSESERIADKEALWQAVDRAVQFGEEFRPADHMKRSSSTTFRARKLTVQELDELAQDQIIESEGSNGSSNGSGGDAEQRRDERYGADAPF